MKFTKHFSVMVMAVAGLLLAGSAHVFCAELAFSGGNVLATNRATVIVSARGFQGGETPSLRWLTATSDLAGAVVTFYRAGAPVKISGASSGGTNRVIFSGSTGTNFNTSNQVLVVRHVASDTYERVVSNTNTSTSVTFFPATVTAVAAGDEVTIHTADATYPLGAATANINHPEGIYHGVPNRPLLFEVNGTTLAKIPLYSGRYWKP